jgi:hypothetical protein
MHVRALASLDVWTGAGDAGPFLAWIRHPETRAHFRTEDFERFTSWNDRLYWESLASLLAGDVATARRLRDELVGARYGSVRQGRHVLDTLGYTQTLTIREEEPAATDRLWHARHLYQATPIGLSPSFNRFCADLLEEIGEPAGAAEMRRRADRLEEP